MQRIQFFSEVQEQAGKQAAGGVLTWIGSWFTSRKTKQPDVTKVKRGVDATKLAETLPKLATDLKSAGLSDTQVLQAMADLVARANAAAETVSKKTRTA